MKNLKSSLFAFSLIIATAFNSNAATNFGPIDSNPATFTEQIQSHLIDINFKSIESSRTVYVKFMINDAEEMIVLGTSDDDFDQSIKGRLNYTKMMDHDLITNQIYTMPITFKSL